MSYHIYTTEAIILKRQAFGEANILLYILTEDLGLIMASARSARLSSSKLRASLQEYSHISISCVKGKNGWKITNASQKSSFFFDYPVYSRRTLSQITFFLMKMITGESPHPEIFQTVSSGFEFLKNLIEKDVANLETLLVLRVLWQLGYVASSSSTEMYIKNTREWNDELLQEVGGNREALVQIINKALKESHL